MQELVHILDSDIKTLMNMRGTFFSDLEAKLYYPILLSYMLGNNAELQRSVDLARASSHTNSIIQTIVFLGELRLLIRSGSLHSSDLEQYIKQTPPESSIWYGEFNFVLSNATASLNLHQQSLNYSLSAARGLKEFGIKKKAVRALMNAIASESCIHPEKHYISDLLYIYQEAKASGDSISVGTTLVNLSREYQKLGLFNIAIKYANRSLAIFSKYNPGGLDYAMALAHRAYLYCEIEVFNSAKLDVEAALFANYPEVQSALKILLEKFPKLKLNSKRIKNNKNLVLKPTPSWTERKSEKFSLHGTKLESKLIETLTKRPQSKSELCDLLYGDLIDTRAKENRLGNLLNRVRKRHPNLITLKGNKYYLSEEPYYTKISSLSK